MFFLVSWNPSIHRCIFCCRCHQVTWEETKTKQRFCYSGETCVQEEDHLPDRPTWYVDPNCFIAHDPPKTLRCILSRHAIDFHGCFWSLNFEILPCSSNEHLKSYDIFFPADTVISPTARLSSFGSPWLRWEFKKVGPTSNCNGFKQSCHQEYGT